MSQEEYDELRQDAIQEDMADQHYEKLMHGDQEYAIEQFASEIDTAYQLLVKVSAQLSNYGHEIKPADLLDMI